MGLKAILKMKVDDKNTVKATFRLDVDLVKKLKYLSVDRNTSVNALVTEALHDFLTKSGAKK